MNTQDRSNHRGPMPAGFFGIAVGSLALAGAWRTAARVWVIPHHLPALLTSAALAVWIALLIAYAHKWIARRDDAIAEMRHPVQSSFVALARLLPWIRRQAFAPSYWAFSFRIAALPTMAIRMLECGARGPVEWLALGLFAVANVAIGLLIVATVKAMMSGHFLPAAPQIERA